MVRKLKQETCVFRVFEALKARDDFMNAAMVQEAAGTNLNQTLASLHHLRKYRAVDVIIDRDGIGWWYATPDTDTRTFTRLEITPEAEPRRARKSTARGPRPKAIKSGK